ncbi:MAG: T9SS type A sorting domain-containing protein [Flavobacteriales bacterium]|nr:T9SS type A sorting domain-containing protein [Flavobacteriales bacterium]
MRSQTEYMLEPNTVDTLSGSPNNNHFIYINQTISAKNKLFLFLPGTFAVPFNYRKILKHAANLGYHSIGLTYPNNQAINSICATSVDTTCHSRARFEIFDGIDRHIDVNVDTNNSIERRTLKLLQYLHINYPSENWEQYFSGNQVNWNKIILSGHSQGGGHAGIISKIKQVDRVAMFAAMDWITLLNRNADWITWNGLTPADRYYGFAHQNDEFLDFNNIQITWNNFGMNNFGGMVLVDTSSSPYNYSRMLYTLELPDNDSTKFHSCVVADAYTPIDTGIPVFSTIWTYMIEGNSNTFSLPNISTFVNTKAYPNPVNSILNITGSSCNNYEYSIYNLQGQKVAFGYLENTSVNVSNLIDGLYFVNIQNENSSKTYKIIKE